MDTVRRGALAPWLLVVTLMVAACGGGGGEVRACSVDDDCGAGALCLQGACVSNRPPVVSLLLPAAPTTHRVLSVEATATDPDAGDAITSYAWTVTSLSAGCDAEPEPTSGARLELVFWCAGSYEVTVEATDARGGTSAPARQTVEVTLAEGTPVVTPAAASAVDHLCSGAGPTCRPARLGGAIPLPLSATVSDPAGGALAYRWRALPPPGVAATISWSHGATSLATDAWLETPGGRIAGTWRFRLRVTTAAGLLGQADQLVEVGNNPPALAADPLRLEHRFVGGSYVATGSLPLPTSDPDGDPVTLALAAVESGTEGCTTTLGDPSGGAAQVEVRCADPARLLGAVSRSLRVRAEDTNGGSAEVLVPVEILNRPPELRLTSNAAGGSLALDHSVGPCPGGVGACFIVAGTTSFEVIDPDGDPVAAPTVTARITAAAAGLGAEATSSGGVTAFRFTGAVAAPVLFRRVDGTTPFALVASAADPFGATGQLAVPVMALNRPPVLKTPLFSSAVSHRYDSTRGSYLASSALATFEDPDGDPLVVVGSSGDAVCRDFSISGGAASVSCALPYKVAAGLPPLAAFVGNHQVVARASDGWAQAESGTTLSIQDGAPAASPFNGEVDSCVCVCAKWSPDGSTCLGTPTWKVDPSSVSLPVLASEADGDPVQVTFSGVSPVDGIQKTVLAGAASGYVTGPSFPVTAQVTVDDGVARAQTSITVTGVVCPTLGKTCTL